MNSTTTPAEVLVIGGTGMLRPAIHDLLHHGARVIAIARRPHRAATHTTDDERFTPVTADWREPAGLRHAAHQAVGNRMITTALIWVHTPYDQTVHDLVDTLVSQDAVIVHLWASAGTDPRTSRPWPTQYHGPRSYRSVVLGYTDTPTGPRWLTDREISDGAIQALHTPTTQQTVGRIDPWSNRP